MNVPLPKFLSPEDVPQVREKRTEPVTMITAVGTRDVKQIIVIRKDLHMRRGKEIAQGAHASMVWLSRRLIHSDHSAIARFSEAEKQWLTTSFRKVTLQVSSDEELLKVYDQAESAGIEAHLITDSGLTEFRGISTITAAALGPDFDDILDPITRHLSLY